MVTKISLKLSSREYLYMSIHTSFVDFMKHINVSETLLYNTYHKVVKCMYRKRREEI